MRKRIFAYSMQNTTRRFLPAVISQFECNHRDKSTRQLWALNVIIKISQWKNACGDIHHWVMHQVTNRNWWLQDQIPLLDFTACREVSWSNEYQVQGHVVTQEEGKSWHRKFWQILKGYYDTILHMFKHVWQRDCICRMDFLCIIHLPLWWGSGNI